MKRSKTQIWSLQGSCPDEITQNFGPFFTVQWGIIDDCFWGNWPDNRAGSKDLLYRHAQTRINFGSLGWSFGIWLIEKQGLVHGHGEHTCAEFGTKWPKNIPSGWTLIVKPPQVSISNSCETTCKIHRNYQPIVRISAAIQLFFAQSMIPLPWKLNIKYYWVKNFLRVNQIDFQIYHT